MNGERIDEYIREGEAEKIGEEAGEDGEVKGGEAAGGDMERQIESAEEKQTEVVRGSSPLMEDVRRPLTETDTDGEDHM